MIKNGFPYNSVVNLQIIQYLLFFAGLLEGAMKLYGSPKSHEFGHQNEEICTENLNVPGSISKSKETRGKSAATSRQITPKNTLILYFILAYFSFPEFLQKHQLTHQKEI